MIKNVEKPAFLYIGLYAKSPNKIDAAQHFWDTFMKEVNNRFTDTVIACENALSSCDKDSFLMAIKQNSRDSAEMVDAMAASIRIDLNSIQARKEVISLYSWLFDFIRLFSLVHELKDKDIKLQANPELQDVFVKTDDLMLKQVVHHLLANAVKDGEADSVIDVCYRSEADRLIIEICYHEEDGREEGAESEKSNQGLGLYISALYIEAMNGSIAIESRGGVKVYSVSIPAVNMPAYDKRA